MQEEEEEEEEEEVHMLRAQVQRWCPHHGILEIVIGKIGTELISRGITRIEQQRRRRRRAGWGRCVVLAMIDIPISQVEP